MCSSRGLFGQIPMGDFFVCPLLEELIVIPLTSGKKCVHHSCPWLKCEHYKCLCQWEHLGDAVYQYWLKVARQLKYLDSQELEHMKFAWLTSIMCICEPCECKNVYDLIRLMRICIGKFTDRLCTYSIMGTKYKWGTLFDMAYMQCKLNIRVLRMPRYIYIA